MIGRLASVLVAALLTLLASDGLASGIASVPFAAVVHDCTYDSQVHEALGNYELPECGPPAAHNHDNADDAFDFRSQGAAGRPNGATPAVIVAYDHPALLVQVTGLATTEHVAAGGIGIGIGIASGDSRASSGASVAANTARAETVVAESRTYVDLTRGGSIRNVGTNATHAEFAETLTQNGWAPRVSSDGAVQIFEQNGARYVLRQQAGSYSGWSADFTPAGSASTTLKLRLGFE
jgi:hypothetical protein